LPELCETRHGAGCKFKLQKDGQVGEGCSFLAFLVTNISPSWAGALSVYDGVNVTKTVGDESNHFESRVAVITS
jgi:hypothetical protein